MASWRLFLAAVITSVALFALTLTSSAGLEDPPNLNACPGFQVSLNARADTFDHWIARNAVEGCREENGVPGNPEP